MTSLAFDKRLIPETQTQNQSWSWLWLHSKKNSIFSCVWSQAFEQLCHMIWCVIYCRSSLLRTSLPPHPSLLSFSPGPEAIMLSWWRTSSLTAWYHLFRKQDGTRAARSHMRSIILRQNGVWGENVQPLAL